MQWDHLVHAYEGHRFLPGTSDGRESRHFAFVREFASVVSLLQDKATALIDISEDISRIVADLATCDFSQEAFSNLLSQIQKIVRHQPD
jgi:dynein heavy chain 1